MLDWRLKALRHWFTMREPDWAHLRIAPIDYQSISYYSAPKNKKDGPKSLDEVDPKLLADLREARRAAARARAARRRRGRCRVRQRLGRDDVQGQARQGRRDLLLVLRRGAEPPRARRAVPRLGGAVHRQLLRDAELRGVLRRLVRLRPEGRALPDGAVDLFPHQRGQHRAVRAHADHRRRRQQRELPRRLHRADARREPAARGGRRARRAGRRQHQVFDRAELVPGRRERRRRHLQLRHQARRMPRRQLAHQLDAGRDRLRDHLEVPELRADGRQLGRRVLLGRAREPLPAGRHRHEDDPHRPQHAQHDRLEGHLGRATARTPIAAS